MPQNHIAQYAVEINRIFQNGNATEHSYRPALQILLQNLAQDLSLPLRITNEPKRINCDIL